MQPPPAAAAAAPGPAGDAAPAPAEADGAEPAASNGEEPAAAGEALDGAEAGKSNDPDATISWTPVSAIDAPLCALVPTIVALRRIEAGEFVMLDAICIDYGINNQMQCQ